MRIQASIKFSCTVTGRKLETQLSTETRNLVMFRQGKVPMRCVFCRQQHHWRLIEYHHLAGKHQRRFAHGTVHAGESHAGASRPALAAMSASSKLPPGVGPT